MGVALYQMGRAEEARAEFLSAVQLDPLNGISRYNLGCVLEEQGEIDQAIDHLERAVRALPAHADVHFNLALAYEKRGEMRLAREQWALYLRHAPNGAVGGTGARPFARNVRCVASAGANSLSPQSVARACNAVI